MNAAAGGGVSVRGPAVAGAFYPSSRKALEESMGAWVRRVKAPEVEGAVRGVVAPHAGHAYCGPVLAQAALLVERAEPERVVLFGPAHHVPLEGTVASPALAWRTPLGEVAVEAPEGVALDAVPHAPEHSLEVVLVFLQYLLDGFELVPLVYGREQPERLARVLDRLAGEDTVLVASSDLSHYHDYKTAQRIDFVANRAVPALDLARFEAEGEACGKTGILALMRVARARGWKGHFVDYLNSGDTAGSRDEVVGYGCYAFTQTR